MLKFNNMSIHLKFKGIISLTLALFIGATSFSQSILPNPDLVEEIRKTEKQFESDLNKMGAEFAFEKHAAPTAVIKRQNDSLIVGARGIKQFYSNDIYKTAKAFWTPDFIDVSLDGTMAYTYGKYRWIMTDKSGKQQEYSGVFHTVWKKQADGTWKYVWD